MRIIGESLYRSMPINIYRRNDSIRKLPLKFSMEYFS
jgi:hypothetical protein